jgi:HKD family nuclease
MKLIKNRSKNSHLKLLKKLIVSSDTITLCTGWINEGGIKKIMPSLKKAINKNAVITIYSNKKHTDGEVTKLIATEPNIKHFVIRKNYLHSKIYYFTKGSQFNVIIGSANLTEGALSTNEELSVQYSGMVNSETDAEIVGYLNEIKDLC